MSPRITSWQPWAESPSPRRTTEIPGRRELALFGLVACAFLGLVVALVPPRFEVPQADDWAYRAGVARMLEEGRFVDLGWGDPTFLLQAAWGGLFAVGFGASYTVLRISTLFLLPLAAVSGYFLLRRVGLGWAIAGGGALWFVANPIALQLAYSFNTDFPFLATSTWAMAALVYAAMERRARTWVLAGTAIAAAFLVRQPGLLLLPIGLTLLWMPLGPSRADRSAGSGVGASGVRSRLQLSVALALPVLLALGVAAWWHPRSLDLPALTNGPLTADGTPPGTMGIRGLREFVASLFTLGLFAIPSLLAGAGRKSPGPGLQIGASQGDGSTRSATGPGTPSETGPLRKRPQSVGRHGLALTSILLLGIGLLLLGPWLSDGQARYTAGWPYQGNYLARAPLIAHEVRTRIGDRTAWTILTHVLPFVAAWLVVRSAWILRTSMGHARSLGLRRDDVAALFVVLMGGGLFIPFVFAPSFYDRYLIPAVLPILVLSGGPLREPLPSVRRKVFLLATLLFLGLSLEWTRFQIDRGQAVWQVASELAREVPAAEVRAGFEWQGHHLFLPALEQLAPHPPFAMTAPFVWGPLVPPFTCEVLEISGPPPPNDGFVARYRGFLRTTPSFVGARFRPDRTP